jgi:phosphohistidine phosphatase SixA
VRAPQTGVPHTLLLCLALLVVLSACAGRAEQATLPTSVALPSTVLPTAPLPTEVPASPTPPATARPSPTIVSSPTPPATARPSPTIASSPTPPPPTPLEGQALLAALQRGGYIIAFRHAATDWSQRDLQHTREMWSDPDPSRMRQLSDAGLAQARAIGAAMRELGIPVGQVLASPYHRTASTARLLALGPVELTADVVNMYAAEHIGGRAQLVASARQRLSTLPSSGTNTMIVTHGNVVQAAAHISLQEGEAAIFAPNGVDGFALVARVLPQEWSALIQADAQAAAQTPSVSAPTPQPGSSDAVCEPTPADDLGQFYTANAPLRTRVGRGYVLSGVVRSVANCAPIPNARIEFWLAGPDGTFDDDHRATVIADASGAYRFESNVPPAYDDKLPHIFMRVTAAEHQTLITRHYPIVNQTEGTFDLNLLPEQ